MHTYTTYERTIGFIIDVVVVAVVVGDGEAIAYMGWIGDGVAPFWTSSAT